MARAGLQRCCRATRYSALALAVLLAACGDGGGVASTNSPNPPPSPPPKPTNDDLVGSLVSEAFVNDAKTQTAYQPITSAQPNTVTSKPLTIEYKASTQTYTITTQGRTQDFGPAQKDATLSNAAATVYKRSEGALTETLSLSTNTTDPGTPDAPLFRYVGAGLWQRTQTDGPNATTTMDYFTYGVPTPASAMPTTGTATFGVRLDGQAGYPQQNYVLTGGGRFQVDFASGGLVGSGTIDRYRNSLYEGTLNWTSQAKLKAGSTTFSGSFNFGARPGAIDGRFYGPHHEEFGAVWSTNLYDNVVASGTILGRDTATMPSNNGLANLVINEDLGGAAVAVSYGRSTRWDQQNLTTRSLYITYSETQKALTIRAGIDGYSGNPRALTPAIRDAAHSDATYDAYSVTTQASSLSAGTLRVSRPGPSNPLIALTYTGFGTSETVLAPSQHSTFPYTDFAYGFGEATPASAVPSSGSATYNGVILGYSGVPSDGNTRPYAISGDARMAYNFGAATLTGTLNPVATDRDTGTSYALGAYAFSGTGDAGKATFAGTFDKIINLPFSGDTRGSIKGQFTGPHAEEFYATWLIGMRDPKGGSNIPVGGVIVGKQGK